MATDFEMVSGDSKVLSVTVRDDKGAILNVSTATKIVFAIINMYNDQVLVQKDRVNGIFADATKVVISLAPADTAGFSGDFMHELEITDVDGQVFTALQGKVLIKRDYIP